MAGPIGRPTKLTPERQAPNCEAIALRGDFRDSALENGIDRATLYRWLRIARQAESKEGREMSALERRCVDFGHTGDEAEAEFHRKDAVRLRRLPS